jgi:chemotaxis protein methyltransferase CheR
MSTVASRTDVEAFRTLLSREIGLRLGDERLPELNELLKSRLSKTGAGSVASYLAVEASKLDELADLAGTLSVSETYFLRNRDQFLALESVLQQREETPTRHLRLLSAGCSTGEEAYSLAITLRNTLRALPEWSISILGVDLNPQSIEKARTGAYGSWSLRETPDAVRKKCFRQEGKLHIVRDELREMVRFDLQNLVQPTGSLWQQDAFDVVFCRNVLMYLTPSAAREVVLAISRSLSPAGYLFLGHAENLRGLSQDFHLRHSHGTFYYQRRPSRECAPRISAAARSTGSGTAIWDEGSWWQAIEKATGRIERLSRDTGRSTNTPLARRAEIPAEDRPPNNPTDLALVMDLMKQERFQEALGLLEGSRADAGAPDTLLLRTMLLVSSGDLATAESLCRELVALDELNAGAHYIMALCRENAGDRLGAIEHHRTASYLDSEFALPHLQLGRLARRSGDLAMARRELGVALGLLAKEDSARIILFGGGFGRQALAELCRGELEACGDDR